MTSVVVVPTGPNPPDGPDFQTQAKLHVIKYNNDRIDKTDGISLGVDDVYIVWFSKTLRNWKAMVGTRFPDGMYYEITHNGYEEETYVDVYKKFDNFCVPDEAVMTWS